MVRSMNILPALDNSLSRWERGVELFGSSLPNPLPAREGTGKFSCCSIGKAAPRIFTLLFATIVLTACSDGVEVTDLGKLEKPAEHEQAAATVEAPAPMERQVVVPDEVQKKFGAVTLAMTRRPEAKEQRLTLKLGSTQTDDGLTVMARDYLPAFVMQAATITSDGVEESNPAVWVEVREGEAVLFRGWLFRDYPELNPPVDPTFTLRLVEAVSSAK